MCGLIFVAVVYPLKRLLLSCREIESRISCEWDCSMIDYQGIFNKWRRSTGLRPVSSNNESCTDYIYIIYPRTYTLVGSHILLLPMIS